MKKIEVFPESGNVLGDIRHESAVYHYRYSKGLRLTEVSDIEAYVQPNILEIAKRYIELGLIFSFRRDHIIISADDSVGGDVMEGAELEFLLA